jgi:hypothetical protein
MIYSNWMIVDLAARVSIDQLERRRPRRQGNIKKPTGTSALQFILIDFL